MASRPTKTAVTITPVQGAPVLITFDDPGAAQRFVTTISDNGDAAAKLEGAVHELPMILNGDFEANDVQSTLRRDFRRAMEGRRFLEARDVERVEDDSGVFWRATALWTFDERPSAAARELEA
jgi:hypothetical protein